jgi:hypothetical protein
LLAERGEMRFGDMRHHGFIVEPSDSARTMMVGRTIIMRVAIDISREAQGFQNSVAVVRGR